MRWRTRSTPRWETLGNTVYYTEPVEATPVNQLESLRALCNDMARGTVDTLLIVGGNPVYDAPHDFDFADQAEESSQYRASQLALR